METAWRNELIKLILSIRNGTEANHLLEAILTPAELKEFAKRWQIVKLLSERHTQRFVRDKVKVSIATVIRGAREVNYGNGIFQKFYSRLYPKSS
ncbi:MAG: transcriptional regulator [Deltaproteobacteria bacterium]|nr:transcriptional regulator [Deltaproteobacteria bacterium]